MAVRHSQLFGSLLRQHRLARGLTQEELAERAQISWRSISDLERGLTRRPYRETVQRLADAFGLSPDERVQFERQARGVPTLAIVPHAPPSNLPHEITSFVGRQAEVSAVAELLQSDVRLVTLLGTGGAGKTRLAVRVGASVLPLFSDGVFFVSLASLRDPRHVLPAIASTLDVREQPQESLSDALKRFLHDKQLLLILDNFEHLLEAGPSVQALLEGNAELRTLVTSRSPLHLTGEHEVPVPPLSVPDLAHPPPADELARNESVALFCDRARAIQPNFTLTEYNASAVAGICARLEGLPLAIELAAPRLRLFSPHVLLDRLSHPLQLLSGGPRDAPQRQQTLRATIDWSHDLLEEGEQALLARLSVFLGSWSFGAAEAVCGVEGELEMVEGMTSLVEQGLIQRRDTDKDEPRFAMLETVREYAVERLEERGETEGMRERHARYFAQFAEQAAPRLIGLQQVRWLDRLEQDLDNFLAAMDWARDARQPDVGLRVLHLTNFFGVRGRYTEVVERAEALLALDGLQDPILRGGALGVIGEQFRVRGDLARAVAYGEESVKLLRKQGAELYLIDCLMWLGLAHAEAGNLSRAREVFAENRTMAEQWGTTVHVGLSLRASSNVARLQGTLEEERALLEQALALFREAGEPRRIANCLRSLGVIAIKQAEYQRAHTLLTDALELFRMIGFPTEIVFCLSKLAYCAMLQGEREQARVLWEECLTVAPHRSEPLDLHYRAEVHLGLGSLAYFEGDPWAARAHLLQTLDLAGWVRDPDLWRPLLATVAVIALEAGDTHLAAHLLGAAHGLRAVTGATLDPAYRRMIESVVESRRGTVGAGEWQRDLREGQVMSLADAVGLAKTYLISQSAPER